MAITTIDKYGKNDLNLCAALTAKELQDDNIYICWNDNKTKKYTIDSAVKEHILAGLALKGIACSDILWLGEIRLKTRDKKLLYTGYSQYISY